MAMVINVSDASLVQNLAQYLARCDCRSSERDPTSLAVVVPTESVDARLARIQLDGYLRTWCSLHAGATAAVADPSPRRRGALHANGTRSRD